MNITHGTGCIYTEKQMISTIKDKLTKDIVNQQNRIKELVDKEIELQNKIIYLHMGFYVKKKPGMISQSEFYNGGVDLVDIRRSLNKHLFFLKQNSVIKGYRLWVDRSFNNREWFLNNKRDYGQLVKVQDYIDALPTESIKEYKERTMTIGDIFSSTVYIECKIEVGL